MKVNKNIPPNESTFPNITGEKKSTIDKSFDKLLIIWLLGVMSWYKFIGALIIFEMQFLCNCLFPNKEFLVILINLI